MEKETGWCFQGSKRSQSILRTLSIWTLSRLRQCLSINGSIVVTRVHQHQCLQKETGWCFQGSKRCQCAGDGFGCNLGTWEWGFMQWQPSAWTDMEMSTSSRGAALSDKGITSILILLQMVLVLHGLSTITYSVKLSWVLLWWCNKIAVWVAVNRSSNSGQMLPTSHCHLLNQYHGCFLWTWCFTPAQNSTLTPHVADPMYLSWLHISIQEATGLYTSYLHSTCQLGCSSYPGRWGWCRPHKQNWHDYSLPEDRASLSDRCIHS